MHFDWFVQITGLIAGVRDAWLLQTDESVNADAVQAFAAGREMQMLLTASGSPYAGMPVRLLRRDVFSARDRLHDVYFSIKELPYTDEELAQDHAVRGKVLNLMGDFAAVGARQPTEITFSFNIDCFYAGEKYHLITYVVTSDELAAAMAHADVLKEKFQAAMPRVSFTVERREILPPILLIGKLRSSVVLSVEERDEIANILENHGLWSENTTIPGNLNQFQRGMLYSLAIFAQFDPFYDSRAYFDISPAVFDRLQKKQKKVAKLLEKALLSANVGTSV